MNTVYCVVLLLSSVCAFQYNMYSMIHRLSAAALCNLQTESLPPAALYIYNTVLKAKLLN